MQLCSIAPCTRCLPTSSANRQERAGQRRTTEWKLAAECSASDASVTVFGRRCRRTQLCFQGWRCSAQVILFEWGGRGVQGGGGGGGRGGEWWNRWVMMSEGPLLLRARDMCTHIFCVAGVGAVWPCRRRCARLLVGLSIGISNHFRLDCQGGTLNPGRDSRFVHDGVTFY